MEERLQKYMAACGIASRRKCEEIILENRVKVNGIVIKELGCKVDASKDIVELDGKIIKKEEKKVYIILNKPEGVVTTVKDEKGRETVIDIVKTEERIFPVGRLDYDSSGLIIMTNDGELYNRIIHPRVEIDKKYVALVKGEVSIEDKEKFENGIDIGGYITAPAKLKMLEYSRRRDISTIEVCIHEGKNRQIRRMCSVLGHDVVSLKRVSIGNIRLGQLRKGEYRELNKEELQYLKSL
ncbi:pseudouridine synthase [uncultured Clostridium sp.]|uniref:pseudouridine synthase n=1 Tax=uncultured Clostridium sp. TaxID=59620 RepID=UPI0025D1975E|nr:pseudouridine synthase [uncultured Clostridium sp.]